MYNKTIKAGKLTMTISKPMPSPLRVSASIDIKAVGVNRKSNSRIINVFEQQFAALRAVLFMPMLSQSMSLALAAFLTYQLNDGSSLDLKMIRHHFDLFQNAFLS